MNWPLVPAALMMAAASAFHAAQTGRLIGPLLADRALPHATRWLAHLCWHAVTLLFAILAAALAAGAGGRLDSDAVRLCGVLALSVAVLAGVATIRAGLPAWRHPATWVLGMVAALAFAGSTRALTGG